MNTLVRPLPEAEQLALITQGVFDFLSLEEPPADEGEADADACSASIHIDGQWQGTLEIRCTPALARQLTAAMFRCSPDAVSDDDLIDALNEIVNIIGGNLKPLLAPAGKLSLPSCLLEASPLQPAGVQVRFVDDTHGSLWVGVR